MKNTPANNTSTTRGPKRKAIKAEVKELNRLGDTCGVSTTARYLLLTLYSYTDQNGYCYPSHSLIGKDTGLAERTIRKALTELGSAGLVRTAKTGKHTNGVKGQFTLEGKKLPRGQSLYLVWPVASAFGKSGFAQLVGLRADENTLKQAEWFVEGVNEKGTPTTFGPYPHAVVTKFIKEGHVKPNRNIRTASGEWFPAVDVPIFSAEFTFPVPLAS